MDVMKLYRDRLKYRLKYLRFTFSDCFFEYLVLQIQHERLQLLTHTLSPSWQQMTQLSIILNIFFYRTCLLTQQLSGMLKRVFFGPFGKTKGSKGRSNISKMCRLVLIDFSSLSSDFELLKIIFRYSNIVIYSCMLLCQSGLGDRESTSQHSSLYAGLLRNPRTHRLQDQEIRGSDRGDMGG